MSDIFFDVICRHTGHNLHSVRITGGVARGSLIATEVIQVTFNAAHCQEMHGTTRSRPTTRTCATSSPTKQVKASSVLDQMDVTETVAMERVDLNEASANHMEEFGRPEHSKSLR